MKVETLILSILSRAIQVGFRPLHWEYPRASVEQSNNFTCVCDCTWIIEDRWTSGLVVGLLIGIALSSLAVGLLIVKYGKPQSVFSPRRRGRGYIYHPSGSDLGVLVQ